MEWIKMGVSLPTHPKVMRIAAELEISKHEVVGCLHYLWSMADQHSVDGLLQGVNSQMIDTEIGVKGLSEALLRVGWLSESQDGSVALPDYHEHNGPTAKRRAQEAKRAAAYRTRDAAKKNAARVTVQRDETVTAQADSDAVRRDEAVTREEKKRGKKKREEPTLLWKFTSSRVNRFPWRKSI